VPIRSDGAKIAGSAGKAAPLDNKYRSAFLVVWASWARELAQAGNRYFYSWPRLTGKDFRLEII